MSLALYRKYRPQKISDLVGQNYLVDILRNTAKKNKVAHAYLFYGPRGTGKTTIARLMAKIANCHNTESLSKKGETCDECVSCREINLGNAMDIIEIDAASNRGIDEIRNLKESIKLAPSSARKKIFIIDEAHMLTKDAFNALLKTLEEPPEHAVLILATTEYEKIPLTITSRTQKFHFKKFTIQEITSKLKKISSSEKIKADEEVLELIASAADGSLRDAESLLDQMSSLSSTIDLLTVEKIIGQVGFKKVIKLADFVINNKLPDALEYLNELNQGGHNITELNKELIFYMRRVLSLKFSPELEKLFKEEMTGEQINYLKQHSQLVNASKQINLLKSLIRAYSEMRYSPFPQIPLEVAIIENLQKIV